MFSFLCLNTFLMFFHNYFLKVVDFIFGSCPKSIVKIEQNVQWLQYTFYAPPNKPCTQFSLCLLSHISLEYLLILMNLNQYNIINYSPQFTLVFVLFCFAHLWILQMHHVTCIPLQFHTTQFHCPKKSHLLHLFIHPFHHPNLRQPLAFSLSLLV